MEEEEQGAVEGKGASSDEVGVEGGEVQDKDKEDRRDRVDGTRCMTEVE